jgi:hypothetical protein
MYLCLCGLENRDYGRSVCAVLITRQHYIREKLALPSPTSGGHSIGIVRSRTQATEFVSVSVHRYMCVHMYIHIRNVSMHVFVLRLCIVSFSLLCLC